MSQRRIARGRSGNENRATPAVPTNVQRKRKRSARKASAIAQATSTTSAAKIGATARSGQLRQRNSNGAVAIAPAAAAALAIASRAGARIPRGSAGNVDSTEETRPILNRRPPEAAVLPPRRPRLVVVWPVNTAGQ